MVGFRMVGSIDVYSYGTDLSKSKPFNYRLKMFCKGMALSFRVRFLSPYCILFQVVHRIGKTLLIDELDLHRILLTSIDEEWKWLRKFFVETILDIIDSGDKPLVRRNKNRDAIVERNLISKFLYRSLNPPGETSLADSIKKETYERQEDESQSKVTQRNITFSLPHLPEPSPEDFEPKFVPSNHEFARTLLWNFEDIRMLIG